MTETLARFRFALDENNARISIDDVPKDLRDRHLHTYICENCRKELIANKGDHKIYYFRHKNRRDDCDTWSEPMTPWHYNGQNLLESLGGTLEISYPGVNGEPGHRADVVLPDIGTAVELQHSSITGEFSERNEFYLAQEGIDNLVWIFDGREFACRMSLLFPDGDYDADTGFADAANRQDMEGIVWKHRHHWYRDFEDDPMGWTQRGLSIAIYLEGGDEWEDGTILELFPHSHPTTYDTLTGHVWRAGDYMRALASGRLPFMRRVPVTYRYQDGSVEQTLCRYGSEMPSPTQCRPLGEAESRKWQSRDGRTLASNVDPHGMVPRDGAEWTETIRKRTVNVAVWLGRNHKTKPRRPEASIDFLITATPDEVVSAVRDVIGERRADDYDWDVLAGKWEDMGIGAEETGIRCTVPILDGHHRYKCSLEDGRTGQVLATRVWEYEGTPLPACLDALRKKVPQDIQGKYNWEMRQTDSEEVLEEESTWTVYPVSEGRPVAVNRREVPVAIRRYESPSSVLWHGRVMSDVTWAELIKHVSENLPEVALMYDLGDLADEVVEVGDASTTQYARLTEAGEEEARRRHDEVMRSIREERNSGFRDVLYDLQTMSEKQVRRAAAPIRKHIVRFLTADGEVLGAYTASHGDMVSEYANRMHERCSSDGSDEEFVWDCVPEARIDGDIEVVVPSSEPVRVVIRLCPEGRDEGKPPVETELSLPKGIALGVMQSLVSRYVNGDDGSFCWPNGPDGLNKNIREPTVLILTPWSYRVMPLDGGGKSNGVGDGESEAMPDAPDGVPNASATNVDIAHEDESEPSQLTLIV